LIKVAFDLRDPQRSGIARVATSLARAFLSRHSDEFSVALAGPLGQLRDLGAGSWGATEMCEWGDARYSLLGLGWLTANRVLGPSTWVFPHWDVPLVAQRSEFVATIHDLAHLELDEFSGIKKRVARTWISLTTRRARALTTVSAYSAERIRRAFPASASKLTVVPNGVDEEFARPIQALPSEIAARLSGAPFMLSAGIRKERKNLRVGVGILRQNPDLKWIVVGEWFPEWEEVEASAREAGVLDRMIVLERQDEATLRALYWLAVFLLFPSRYEGFGLPILESLASGTPVIASRSTSIPEVLGDAGWMCDPDDAECFARSATEVLNLGRKRAAVVERGRARAREFTWGRSADALARVLRASPARNAR
jgi:glycosyltransferase involved in cell wall biosynthesis